MIAIPLGVVIDGVLSGLAHSLFHDDRFKTGAPT
jgi:hypothetical protein